MRKPGGTDGFTALWEHGRLDLSVGGEYPETGVQGAVHR